MSLRNSASCFLRWYTCRLSSSFFHEIVWFTFHQTWASRVTCSGKFGIFLEILQQTFFEFVLVLASFTRIELTGFFFKTHDLRKHPTFCDATKVVFPRMDVWRFVSANQKHYPDQDSDTSSVWNLKMKKWSSQWTQFMQLHKEAWKKNSGLQRGLNPWPRDALPTELWSHWRWEQVNRGFICSRERNEC